jgi:glycosyltransferase involved in cell wall biosynthesis
MNCSGNFDPRILLRLARVIKEFHPSIVHSWILQMDVLGGAAARVMGVPWVLREPNCGPCYPPGWRTTLRTWIARYASVIVSNSQGGDAYWASRRPDTPRLIIPNGIGADSTRGGRSAGGGQRASEEKLLLYVGRLQAEKNVERLVQAFAQVPPRLAARLLICGEGVRRHAIEEMVASLNLEDRVTLLGYLPRSAVLDLMRTADALVLLSDYEGFPNVVGEAMACECPVILSDIPAHRELVPSGCGLLVDHRNPSRVADAISKALSDPGAVGEQVRRARLQIQRFSVAVMVAQYERLYYSVLEDSRRVGKGAVMTLSDGGGH